MDTTEHATTDKIDVIDIAPRVAAVVRKTVRMAEMPQAQREAHAILGAALGTTVPTGPRLTVWRPPQGGAIDYAPGVFVPEDFAASGGVTRLPLPAGRAAHFRLDGPYERLPGAWQRLFAACDAQGLTLAGLNWEVYTNQGPDPKTDLYTLLAAPTPAGQER